ncbi:phage portal protein [Marinococcus halophilus]|uniref:phage portal protein n=1 Tax=Marinococcus halophilus TaxID=1371 RepID=UPI0009A84892|nr:phage portal protein [Marinococcus halophilus]
MTDSVNNFERDLDVSRYRFGNSRFDPEANLDYRLTSLSELTPERLAKLVEHHRNKQQPRLKELEAYYRGDNKEILQRSSRRTYEEDADHRATHNFARYVSTFIQGYLAGVPIKPQHAKENVTTSIEQTDKVNDAEGLNSDLILDCSIFGRGFELFYRNFEDKNRVSRSDAKHTFVVYDTTVDMRPLAGVRYKEWTDENNAPCMSVELYTDTRIISYRVDQPADIQLKEEKNIPHGWQTVPLNEYRNNRYRQGDFENVLNLIDLYDAAQSDIANYMTDLNDALLKITGNLNMTLEQAVAQRKAKLLYLQPPVNEEGREGRADADFIYKKYDVQGVESYKDRLQEDIHKFTNTPNMNDENFAGQQTGEAMKYKLFGLEQVRAMKERLFRQAMIRRYRIFANMSTKAKDENAIDPNEVNNIDVVFTPNLPKSLSEQLEQFMKAGGRLSQETTFDLIPSIVKDKQAEMERLRKEDEAEEAQYDKEDFSGVGRDNT